MNKIAHLPSELISLVLNHVNKLDLYACTLINKPFHKVALPLLWRRLDIVAEDQLTRLTTVMATSPHSPGEHVRYLAIMQCISDTDLMAVIQHVPQVEHLQLNKAQQLSDTSFQQVPSYCPNLISLDIYASQITLVSMESLAQHCRQLAVLRLKFCPSLDYAKLFSVLQGCPLKEIDIIPCYLDDHMTSERLAEALALHLAGFSELTDIRLNGMFMDCTTFITTVNAHGIAWPSLIRFEITACMGVDDSMAITFLQAHPRLRSLTWGRSNITDRTLDAMATCLREISDLRVQDNRQLSASGVYRLIKHCPTLVDGVHCAMCDIFTTDDDFPAGLASDAYAVRGTGTEVIWFAA